MISNRIGRLELLFWYFASIVGAGIMVALVAALTNTTIEPDRTRHPWPQALALIAASLVMLKAQASRFHDIGWSGRAVLLMFVPLVNVVALLLLMVVPGQKQPNEYGDQTKFLQWLRGQKEAV
jgi:uncharacterized membrane protein YhaH (DUF805 family)